MKTTEIDIETSFKESGMQLSGIQSANAIATTTPQNGWLLVAPFGEFPSPDRRYVQVFQREQADEIVRSWNSMVGKAFRYVKNVRHKLKFRDTAPVFDHQYLEGHPDTDPANWSQLQELARVRDLRSSNAGLEALIEWDHEGMATRNAGPLFPSIQWWHNAPNDEGKVFPGHFESITLTRTPNITSVPAWTPNSNQNQNPMNEEQLKALRKSLNLSDTTSVEKVIETAQSAYQLSTSNATALQTANSAKETAEKDLKTANEAKDKAEADLKTANTAKDKAEGEVKVLATTNSLLIEGIADLFETNGKFTPAERPGVIAKFTANVGDSVKAVITELKEKKPVIETKHLEINGNRIDISTANARRDAVENAVSKCMKDNGIEDRNVAFAKVQADPQYAQLFAAMQDPTRKAA